MNDNVADNPDNVHRIELGDEVQDVVTGATGIVASYSKHLTGCDTVTVELGITPEGKMPLVAFDVTRLEIITKGKIKKSSLPGFKDIFDGPVPAAG